MMPTDSVPPLVSCIMPTHDRRRFVPLALHYFLRQDYPHRELVVVDDGADPVADLIPDDPRIRYIRLNRRLSVGAKRNHAVRGARGELIAHWRTTISAWRVRRRLLGQRGSVSSGFSIWQAR